MRIEHDLLGQKSIPDDAYHGVESILAFGLFALSILLSGPAATVSHAHACLRGTWRVLIGLAKFVL